MPERDTSEPVGRRAFLRTSTGAAMSLSGLALLSSGCGLAPFLTRPRMARVGYLSNSRPDAPFTLDNLAALRQGLRQYGWIEGDNLVIETRYAGQDDLQFDPAVELARLPVDVIFSTNPAGGVAAKRATTTVPIVTSCGQSCPAWCG